MTRSETLVISRPPNPPSASLTPPVPALPPSTVPSDPSGAAGLSLPSGISALPSPVPSPDGRRGSASTQGSTGSSAASTRSKGGESFSSNGREYKVYPRPRRQSAASSTAPAPEAPPMARGASTTSQASSGTGSKLAQKWKAFFSPSSPSSSRQSASSAVSSRTSSNAPTPRPGSSAMVKSASVDSPALTPRASRYFANGSGSIGPAAEASPAAAVTAAATTLDARRASVPLSPRLESAAVVQESPTRRWKKPRFGARPATSSGTPGAFGQSNGLSASLPPSTAAPSASSSSSPAPPAASSSPAKARLRTRPATSSGAPSHSFGSSSNRASTFVSSELNDAFHLSRAPTPARPSSSAHAQEDDGPSPVRAGGLAAFGFGRRKSTAALLSSSTLSVDAASASGTGAGSKAPSVLSMSGSTSTATGAGRLSCIAPIAESPTLPSNGAFTAHQRSTSAASSASTAASGSTSTPTQTLSGSTTRARGPLGSSLPPSPTSAVFHESVYAQRDRALSHSGLAGPKKKPSLSEAALKARALLHRRHPGSGGGGEDAESEGAEELSQPTEEEIASWRRGHGHGRRSGSTGRDEMMEILGDGGRGGRERSWSAGGGGARARSRSLGRMERLVVGAAPSESQGEGAPTGHGLDRRGSDSSDDADVLVISSRPQSRADVLNAAPALAPAPAEAKATFPTAPATAFPPRTSAVPLFPTRPHTATTAASVVPDQPTSSTSAFLSSKLFSPLALADDDAPASSSPPFPSSPTSASRARARPQAQADDGLNVLDFIALDEGRTEALPFRFPQASPPKMGAFFPAPRLSRLGSAQSGESERMSLGSDEDMLLDALENPARLGSAKTASAGSSPLLFSAPRHVAPPSSSSDDPSTPGGGASRLPAAMQKLFASPALKGGRTAPDSPGSAMASTFGGSLARTPPPLSVPSTRAAVPQSPPAAAAVHVHTSALPASAFSPSSPPSSPRKPASPVLSTSPPSSPPQPQPLSAPAKPRRPSAASIASALSTSPPPPRPPRASSRPGTSPSPSSSPEKPRTLGAGGAWAPVSPSTSPSNSKTGGASPDKRPVRPRKSSVRLRRGSASTSTGTEETPREAPGGLVERRKFTPPPSPPSSQEEGARRGRLATQARVEGRVEEVVAA
ncbi:hypothetical protein JCM10207_000293 [Rhodosporidiobolus poonsookiae]